MSLSVLLKLISKVGSTNIYRNMHYIRIVTVFYIRWQGVPVYICAYAYNMHITRIAYILHTIFHEFA